MNTNQKPKANTVSSTKTAECGVRLKNFCLSKVLCIFPFLSKKISSKKQSIASTENSLQFFASKVLVLRKNKTTISRTSSYPFFSYSETLVLGNLFKVFRLAVTELAWEVCDTSQLIWTVQMMRLQGFKRRCWEVSIVGLADLSSCHLKPHTPIVMNLAYYETEGGWIEQNYLLIQHMGHSMIFPKKITSPHCFLPVSTTVANMR